MPPGHRIAPAGSVPPSGSLALTDLTAHMDTGPLSGRGYDLEAGHKALHDRKAHATAVSSSGSKGGTPCLLQIRDTNASVLDHNIQNIIF